MSVIRDIDIRQSLRNETLKQFREDGTSLIVEELGIESGNIRIDVAVVNGALHGFEIKSDADTLLRLPAQAGAYNKVFDFMTIIVGRKFIAKIEDHIPKWWGICLAEKDATGIPANISTTREPKRNTSVDGFSIARLLWREELIDILKKHGAARGFLSKPRTVLSQHLATVLPLPLLQEEVRMTIKSRTSWRLDSPQK